MSRATNRSGRAPLLTSVELGKRLALPLLLISDGVISPKFPLSGRARPSQFVLLSGKGLLPLMVNGIQWEKVAVPILNGGKILGWRGRIPQFGSDLTVPSDVYGPSRTKVFSKGESMGKTTEYKSATPGLLSEDQNLGPLETDLLIEKGSEVETYLKTVTGSTVRLVANLITTTAVSAGYK